MVLGPRPRLWLPYLNFTIASSALLFQTAVLYPWHNELDQSFSKVQADQKLLLKEYYGVKEQQLEAITQRINEIEDRLDRADEAGKKSAF